jgi:ACS family pantothenate transporter-like MFS transporter
LITLPIAIYGYFFFPDTPHTTTAPYFSAEEKALARARVPLTEEREAIFTLAFLSRILKTWYFYGFCMLWILGNCSEAQSSQSLLNLYMQAHQTDQNYTVIQLNNWPTGVQAVGVVSTLVWALGTDIWGGRWISGYYVAVTAICNAAIILAPNSSVAAKLGAYYWAGSIYCIQATFFAWANDSMRHQPPTLRAAIIGCMNFAGNLFQTWWPLVFYRSDAAPNFTVSE